MSTAADALERLKAGNARFVSGTSELDTLASQSRREALVDIQEPFAIVLGCSDSRVPNEIVFDQGMGDLFVVRVAGNIVTPAVIGSIEFSALNHGAKLIVVLGHTSCGAVQATVDSFDQGTDGLSPNLAKIVESIRPSVQTAKNAGIGQDSEQLVHQAGRANIDLSVSRLRSESTVLEKLIVNEGLRIVGAEYSLASGCVEFFS